MRGVRVSIIRASLFKYSTMKRYRSLRIAILAFSFLPLAAGAASPTAFQKVGSGAESTQEFFPGEHRARPVMGAYTSSAMMGIFSGGQDLGGSTGWYNDNRWGDLGDGTFANPVLNADYSDPDVIRVGDKYYMTCSEFHFMGMPILESDDMVNWRIIGQVFDSIDLPGYDTMDKYGSGSWAPALRYHDGRFRIFVCTPGEGLFMASATDPAGPWTPLHAVREVSGWEDPCPLWDDNGDAFLGRSQLGGGPIYIHRMSPDGTRLLDDGVKVYEGPTAEGTKLFKKDGYYYLSIPEGGVGTGWQTVLRADNIYGPYEGKRVLEMGATRVNGPHQGALVDTPEGEWWFYHFQSTGVLGRVMHLQPVKWIDGFPFIGEDYDNNGIGEPMKVCAKPATGVVQPPFTPQTSDNFDSGVLGIQWQTNHNPEKTHISFADREGWLTLSPLKAGKIRNSRNQLTQKLMGNRGIVTACLDFTQMKEGDRAGIECIGNKFMGLGVMVNTVDGRLNPVLYIETDGRADARKALYNKGTDTVWLRMEANAADNRFTFSYSLDGEEFNTVGDSFEMGEGDWKGVRTGIYSYTIGEAATAGKALFDFFTYEVDGPGLLGQSE